MPLDLSFGMQSILVARILLQALVYELQALAELLQHACGMRRWEKAEMMLV